MAGFSDYLEEKLLKHTFMNTAYTTPTTVYVGLLTVIPTDSTTGTEVTGGSYARVAATFQQQGSSVWTIENASNITFPTATASWGTVVAAGVYDALTGGNLLCYVAVTIPGDSATANPKAVEIGDIFRISAANLTIALD